MRRQNVATSALVAFLVTAVAIKANPAKPSYCTPSNASCWPTKEKLDELYQLLDPSISRQLTYKNTETPNSAVPYGSPLEQPLYGAGKDMKPLYVQQESDTKGMCFVNDFFPEYCKIATRNNPIKGQPAFVAWPTNTTQVQTLVKFAKDHNLCVAVAGTGHDFINRHTCEDTPGLFIRMALFKAHNHNLNDTRGPGGTIQLGAGTVFGEAHQHAAEINRYISSGWSKSVGVVGWTLGGGHGPMSQASGLGVDNLVEAEVVLADGTIAVVNATGPYSDLFWALRGGGGSTWGIITHVTVKLHPIPEGGFTEFKYNWSGDFCSGIDLLTSSVEEYYSWAQSLNEKWSGLIFFAPSPATDESSCATWTASLTYVFMGDYKIFPEFLETIKDFPKDGIFYKQYTNWFNFVQLSSLEYIYPFPWTPPDSKAAGLPSVLVNKTMVSNGAIAKFTVDQLKRCNTDSKICIRQEIYHDITGNKNSVQDPNVSISPAFRTAYFHYVMTFANNFTLGPTTDITDVLGQHAYFSESHYNAENWKWRYWGENYQKLSMIKSKYDPEGRFSCHHCVERADIAPVASNNGTENPTVSSIVPTLSIKAYSDVNLAVSTGIWSKTLSPTSTIRANSAFQRSISLHYFIVVVFSSFSFLLLIF